MNALGCRWVVMAMLAAALSLAGCGDEKTSRRARSAKTDKTDTDKTDADKTAKTEGGDSGKPVATVGWGSLKGRFVVTGTVPPPREITVTANPEYCDPFKAKGELRYETVVVSAKNELKNVVVYLAKKPDRIHEDYKKNETAEVALDNHHCRFEPHITLLRTTQTLRIKNSDPMGHNTKLDAFGLEFNELLPSGSPGIIKQLTREQRYPVPYGCNVHGWMKGHLLLLSHPYMAVSGDDGSFEIKNLPAGEWEFQFWHEAPGPLEIGDWKKGRAKIVIKPGTEPTDLGKIEVPADKLKAG
jgi:hypothetical protein